MTTGHAYAALERSVKRSIAPISGRLAAVQAEIGRQANTKMPLAAIVPQDSNFSVNLLAPSRSAGSIKVGQAVRIKIDAFPYQYYGIFHGSVTSISKSVYRPGEFFSPISYEESVYVVNVSLDRNWVSVNGEHRPLSTGMTLSGSVVVEERRLAEWILGPIRTLSSQ